MLEQGIFKDVKPDAIYAQHVAPELETGKVGFRSGAYMASNDEVHLTIKGKGGHAAFPHETVDSVLIASKIIVALKKKIPEKKHHPSILSFGRVHAPGATNVIPGEVKVAGTFRTFDEEWRNEAHRIIRETSTTIAREEGASCDVSIPTGYPVLVNDEVTTQKARQAAAAYVGEGNVVDLDLRMSSEDFAHFAQEYPATFYRIGIKKPGTQRIYNLHTSSFFVDESVLEIACGTMAWIAISGLLKT
jgi:amidohydrolase